MAAHILKLIFQESYIYITKILGFHPFHWVFSQFPNAKEERKKGKTDHMYGRIYWVTVYITLLHFCSAGRQFVETSLKKLLYNAMHCVSDYFDDLWGSISIH